MINAILVEVKLTAMGRQRQIGLSTGKYDPQQFAHRPDGPADINPRYNPSLKAVTRFSDDVDSRRINVRGRPRPSSPNIATQKGQPTAPPGAASVHTPTMLHRSASAQPVLPSVVRASAPLVAQSDQWAEPPPSLAQGPTLQEPPQGQSSQSIRRPSSSRATSSSRKPGSSSQRPIRHPSSSRAASSSRKSGSSSQRPTSNPPPGSDSGTHARRPRTVAVHAPNMSKFRVTPSHPPPSTRNKAESSSAKTAPTPGPPPMEFVMVLDQGAGGSS